MSLHKFAEQVAAHGRGDDSLLVHMTPDEVRRLQAFAEANGTTMTINPDTGLPEAGFLSDLFKAVAPIALGAFLGPAGAAIGGGFMSAGMAGLTVGGLTTLATGSLSRGLMAGMGAYGGAGLGAGLESAGTSALAADATGVASGQMMSDILAERGILPTLESGAVNPEYITEANKAVSNAVSQGTNASTAAKMSAGLGSIANDPLSFAKDNFKYLGAAAAPIMADMMVPTTTKQPDARSTDTINQFIYGPNGQYRRLNPVPAAGYGTPAFKPFADGGIVALNNGGVAHYETGGGVKDLTNLYNVFGGKEGYEKLQADYLKINNNPADFAAVMAQYDKPSAFTPAAVTPAVTAAATPAVGAGAGTPPAKMTYEYAAANPGSVDWLSDAGKQLAMDNYINTYNKDLTTKFKTPAEQALELMYRSTTGGSPTAAYDALGGYATAKKLAQSAGFDATPEWQQEYEKKMGYTVIPRMSTAAVIAADKAASDRAVAEKFAADKAAADKATADALTAANKVSTTGTVDLGTTTAVSQDKADTTTTGKNTLATTTASGVTSPKTTTDGTYTGTTGSAPTMGTLFGQGKFVGTGTEAGTGTTGPIVDFGNTAGFSTAPLKLAQTQIAEQSAAKNAADKTKLDLYSQWGAANPKATNLEHANFVDKIGLDPAVAAQLIGISPEQAQNAYNDAKYNKMSGDSQAAYNYLMGQGAYPTKSKVGEIARPYAEATLGYPVDKNRQYIYDQATGKYVQNPDYVAEYKDPSGGVNYLMSPSEIFQYFKANQGQADSATYDWAVENNLTPQEISAATGVPLSTVAAKWRAAKTKKATAAKTAADTAATAAGKTDTLDASSTGGAAAGGLQGLAMGGMPSYAVGGGLGSLGSYSDGGRLLKGPGDGVSDSIPATIGQKQQPARLADGEFVVPARIVSELGNGSTEAGAKKLYAMMDRVQRARGKTTGKNKVAANSRADKYLPA